MTREAQTIGPSSNKTLRRFIYQKRERLPGHPTFEIVEVIRYLGAEPDAGCCTAWNRGHHSSGPVHHDDFIGPLEGPPVRA